MKKIGIIELATHNEVLVNYCRIFIAAGFELRVFTNDFNYHQIGDVADNCEWIIQEKDQTDEFFLTEHLSEINECDLVIFLTIYKDYDFYSKIHIVPPKGWVIHKSITNISIKKQFIWSKEPMLFAKDFIKILLFFLFKESGKQNRLTHKFDFLIFPSKKMQSYAWEMKWRIPPSIVIDFAVHEKMKYLKESKDFIQISIPGVVNDKSRDYKIVIEAFKKLRTTKKIRLILLGQPLSKYGFRVIQEFKKLESPFFKFVYFDSFIEQRKFDEILIKSDFLLLPIMKYMKVGIFKEKNGYTCVSGNVNDFLKFGIPSIIPSYYPLEDNQKVLTDFYDSSEELAKIISSWLENLTYVKKRKIDPVLLKGYRVENIGRIVRKKFESLGFKHLN